MAGDRVGLAGEHVAHRAVAERRLAHEQLAAERPAQLHRAVEEAAGDRGQGGRRQAREAHGAQGGTREHDPRDEWDGTQDERVHAPLPVVLAEAGQGGDDDRHPRDAAAHRRDGTGGEQRGRDPPPPPVHEREGDDDHEHAEACVAELRDDDAAGEALRHLARRGVSDDAQLASGGHDDLGDGVLDAEQGGGPAGPAWCSWVRSHDRMLRPRGSAAGPVGAPRTATWVGPRRDLRRTSPRAPRPTLVIVLPRVHTWLDRHPAAGDAGVAVVLLLFCLSTFVGGERDAGVVDVVFTVLLCAPLAVRRRAPVATFAAVMVLCAAELLLVDSFLAANAAALVALYTLVVYAPRPLAAAGVCVALAGTVPFALHFDDLGSSDDARLGRDDRAPPAGGAPRRPHARGARAAGRGRGVR